MHLFPGKGELNLYANAPGTISRLLDYVRPYSLQDKLRRPSQQRMRIKIKDSDKTGYLGEIREFLAAVTEERQPVTPPHDARRDLQVVLAGYRASTTRTWEIVPEAERMVANADLWRRDRVNAPSQSPIVSP
jgi:predicted dehydrogenase